MGSGKWRQANRHRPLQTATQSGVMPPPTLTTAVSTLMRPNGLCQVRGWRPSPFLRLSPPAPHTRFDLCSYLCSALSPPPLKLRVPTCGCVQGPGGRHAAQLWGPGGPWARPPADAAALPSSSSPVPGLLWCARALLALSAGPQSVRRPHSPVPLPAPSEGGGA